MILTGSRRPMTEAVARHVGTRVNQYREGIYHRTLLCKLLRGHSPQRPLALLQ